MTDTNSKAQVTDARERECFERFLVDDGWGEEGVGPDLTRFGGLYYADHRINAAWIAWKGRAALAAQEKPEPGVAVREAAAFLLWYKDRGKNTDDCVEAWDALRTALRSPVEITPEKIDAGRAALRDAEEGTP